MDEQPILRILPSYIRASDWAAKRPMEFWQRQEPDPRVTGPTQEPHRSIWAATCRITTNRGVGSGFFVSINPFFIVTCAHVVDGVSEITVERSIGGGAFFEHWPAVLVSIDYSHDLAIVHIEDPQHVAIGATEDEPWNSFPAAKLEPAGAPSPGDAVIICGFPEGVDNPRLATGLVSGYDSIRPDRVSIDAVALDASINPGNSGGPVCDEDGKLVGVVFARPSSLKLVEPLLSGVNKKVLAVLRELNANNGIGYALDPRDVTQLFCSYLNFCQLTSRTYRLYAPPTVRMAKDSFVELQVECRDLGLCPVGVFSFSTDWKLHHGWLNSEARTLLRAEGWRDCLSSISRTGGSFLLRGYEVLLYRQKYGGYIVPVVFALT